MGGGHPGAAARQQDPPLPWDGAQRGALCNGCCGASWVLFHMAPEPVISRSIQTMGFLSLVCGLGLIACSAAALAADASAPLEVLAGAAALQRGSR